MAEKPKGKSSVGHYANYKSNKTWEINRRRKLEKTLKAQPNNEQVKLALKSINYRRKKPVKREWSASWIAIAKIFKLFSGRFDRDIMSSNQEVAKAILAKAGPIAMRNEPMPLYPKNFFALSLRNSLNGKG